MTRIQFHLLIAVTGFMGLCGYATGWEWASGTAPPTFHLLPFIGLSVLHGVIATWEAYEGQRALRLQVAFLGMAAAIKQAGVALDGATLIVSAPVADMMRAWRKEHEEGLSK